jgi:hypothetical protein
MTVSDQSASIIARLRTALDKVAPESLAIAESFIIEIDATETGQNRKSTNEDRIPIDSPRWWIKVSPEEIKVVDKAGRTPEVALLKVHLNPSFFDQVLNGTATAEQLVNEGAIKLGGDTRILREASSVIQALAAAVLS